MDDISHKKIPLNLFLARSGIASRRHAAEFIRNGQVTVNGEIMLNPGYRVEDTDCVCCDNIEVKGPASDAVYIMLNKPPGYECSRPGRFTERTVFDLVDIPDTRLFTIGRLDKNSEGLLLLTTDGELAQRLTHPSSEIKKTYILTVRYPLKRTDIRCMTKGIEDEGEFLKAAEILTEEPPFVWRFVLTEGKKREIRRLISHVGNETERLCRVAIGGLTLGSLKSGQYRSLTTQDLRLLEQSSLHI